MNIENYLDKIFDNVDSNIILDSEQKNIVKNESNCLLVVAGAGSGKTTVISAKVKYLIDIKKVNPEEILVISFTNESVNDLKKQINDKFCLSIKIQTFHKLGLEIIGFDKKYRIVDNLENILKSYFFRDIYFTNDYLHYLEYLYTYIDCQNLNRIKIKDKKEYVFESLEEVSIYNFLKLNNISFKYRIVNFNNVNSEFVFYKNNTKIIVRYLKYLKRNKKKKYYYIDLVENTNVIKKLSIELFNLGFSDYFINNNDIIYNKFLSLCCSFINNYKVNYIDENYFNILNKKYMNNLQIIGFLKIVYKAYKYYKNYNIKNKIIDFNDIINDSIQILKNNNPLKYKYLIVDEFQDVSKNRLEIIKLLVYYGVNFMALGDDWQAIYGFAGSNVNLFTNFNKFIKNSNVLKISKTYRNSQQLIDIAGDFVMKNNCQLKKNLLSDKSLDYPINVYFYDDKINKNEVLYNLLYEFYKKNKGVKILLLGRYKHELYNLIDKNYFGIKNNKIVCLKAPINIDFLTVHSSKGLTYDEVIILNLDDDIYGFPSQVVDNYLLSILKEKDNFYLEEERRLFYVALTRTRNHNYIFSNIDKPSIYLLELIKNKNINIENLTNKKIKFNKMICLNCGYFSLKSNYCPNCKNKM